MMKCIIVGGADINNYDYIKNAKYPLDNAEIEGEYQYGISFEVIKGKIQQSLFQTKSSCS